MEIPAITIHASIQHGKEHPGHSNRKCEWAEYQQDETLIPESLKGWYSDEELSSDDDFKENENMDSSEVHTDEE